MKPKLRGILEKDFDGLLGPDYLETLKNLYEGYKPLVKSIEDAMFGDIVATITERFIHYTLMFERERPSEADKIEMYESIQRRSQEIKSKILLATSR